MLEMHNLQPFSEISSKRLHLQGHQRTAFVCNNSLASISNLAWAQPANDRQVFTEEADFPCWDVQALTCTCVSYWQLAASHSAESQDP